MLTELDPVEARVLGSLVEKSLTTREQYPLTFNALLNACNQKTSREPVMNLDTDAMGRAVQTLIEKSLVERLQAPGVRGPQTPGEIKGRTDRLCEFAGTAEVEGLLQELCARAEDPLVARLPRQAGQKEARYQHLFSGAAPAGQDEIPAAAPAAQDRLAQLEKRVEALEAFVKAQQDSLSKPG